MRKAKLAFKWPAKQSALKRLRRSAGVHSSSGLRGWGWGCPQAGGLRHQFFQSGFSLSVSIAGLRLQVHFYRFRQKWTSASWRIGGSESGTAQSCCSREGGAGVICGPGGFCHAAQPLMLLWRNQLELCRAEEHLPAWMQEWAGPSARVTNRPRLPWRPHFKRLPIHR